MYFLKEGIATAIIAVIGEKLFVKSGHLPEAFITVLASTILAKYIMNKEKEVRIFKAPLYTSEAKSFPFTPAPPVKPTPNKV